MQHPMDDERPVTAGLPLAFSWTMLAIGTPAARSAEILRIIASIRTGTVTAFAHHAAARLISATERRRRGPA
jgi:hypothetical protein